MKKINKLIVVLLISVPVFAMDIYEEVANSIRSGDAKQLSSYFSNNIDLTICENENVYSKAQAELIIKDFFGKNPPKAFNMLHKGSSPEGTQYLIGNLITTNGKTFRTSFFLKSDKGKYYLQELRIENE
jgi:hypothetical protein